MAVFGNESAGDDGEEGDCQDHGKVPHAGLGGRDAGDGLEVDGEVVEEGEESSRQEEDVEAGDDDGALSQQAVLQQRALAHEVFIYEEDDEQEDEADEGADHGGVGPGVCDAALLQGEEVADYGGHDGEGTYRVHLEEFLRQGCRCGFCRVRGAEGGEDNEGGGAADGEVDVEARCD